MSEKHSLSKERHQKHRGKAVSQHGTTAEEQGKGSVSAWNDRRRTGERQCLSTRERQCLNYLSEVKQ